MNALRGKASKAIREIYRHPVSSRPCAQWLNAVACFYFAQPFDILTGRNVRIG
jgi:hypothetical protein